MDQEYDLAVVGAGLAGLTAALFGARYGLKTVIVDPMGAGGQVVNAEEIANFPGSLDGISGFDLGETVQAQAQAAGAEVMIDEVTSITPGDPLHRLSIGNFGPSVEFGARSVIVAVGSKLRRLGVPGEQEFMGRGVSSCASCDGPFFDNQTVCVVGGGDSALEEALTLTHHASRVLLVHRGEAFDGQQALVDQVLAAPSIEVRWRNELEEIKGDGTVHGVRLRDAASGQSVEEVVSGVFVYVGLEPNSSLLEGVAPLDRSGHVATDIWMRTAVPGIFAAGDVRQHSASQLVTAAGDGATAAIAAYRYVRGVE